MPKIEYADPAQYSLDQPLHIAIFGYNGVGKSSFAGKSGLRTLLMDCGDAGAITLRNVKSGLRIVRVRSINHYLDIIADAIAKKDQIDLLVPDTVTGIQTMAIKEVKPKRTFDMNQKKWGQVSSRVIECLAETRNFPNDVVYLVQEKKKGSSDDGGSGEITPGLTPSIRGYLSSIVDWVGYLHLQTKDDDDGNEITKRVLDFRIREGLEVKDRAGLFPKLIVNPTYMAIRKRIYDQLKGDAASA